MENNTELEYLYNLVKRLLKCKCVKNKNNVIFKKIGKIIFKYILIICNVYRENIKKNIYRN